MWKLTSWGFWKCGSFQELVVLNQSYWLSKSGENWRIPWEGGVTKKRHAFNNGFFGLKRIAGPFNMLVQHGWCIQLGFHFVQLRPSHCCLCPAGWLSFFRWLFGSVAEFQFLISSLFFFFLLFCVGQSLSSSRWALFRL